MSERLKQTLNDIAQVIRGNTTIADTHPLATYQVLAHNNLNSVVSPCFPVIQSILSSKSWHELIDGFLQNYQASFTSYHRVSEHFVDFLSQLNNLPYPFISELAHYEWLELAVETADIPVRPKTLNNPVEDTQWTMPPSARFQLYDYPVHLIGANYLPESSTPTALIVYRPYQKRDIEFMKINTLSCHCLHFLINEGYTLNEYLQAISKQQQVPISKDIMQQFCQFLSSLHQQSIIQPK